MKNILDMFNEMRGIELAVVFFAILPFIVLGISIVKTRHKNGIERGAGQNTVSWCIYALLDLIQLPITIMAGYNYILIGCFAIGSLCMAIVLIIFKGFTVKNEAAAEKKRRKHDNIITLVCVLFCVALWLTTGAKTAIYFAILSQWIASYPLLRDTKNKPSVDAYPANFIFGITTILSLIANTTNDDFKFADILFPVAMLLLNIFVQYLILIKLHNEIWESFCDWIANIGFKILKIFPVILLGLLSFKTVKGLAVGFIEFGSHTKNMSQHCT